MFWGLVGWGESFSGERHEVEGRKLYIEVFDGWTDLRGGDGDFDQINLIHSYAKIVGVGGWDFGGDWGI